MSRLTDEDRQNVRLAKGSVKAHGKLGQAMSETLIKIIERLDRGHDTKPIPIRRKHSANEDPIDDHEGA